MTAIQINNASINKIILFLSVISYGCTVNLEPFFKKQNLQDCDKLGLSSFNIPEFVEILDVLLISTERSPDVNKFSR